MTLLAGRYEIKDALGRGGSGEVYRAWDHNLGRELALKLLPGGSEEILVVREAHALTALESPHILGVLDAGIDQDIPFIATEIARMGSTEDQIVDGIGVAPRLAVRWVRQALVGLALCHRKNVIHRDLTPANIFLDSQDLALLGDFGAAANLGADGTAEPAGNQLCRAPEGYGGRLTARSDLFSAGVSLWRLLTGCWPFEAETGDELGALMRRAKRHRLRDLAPHVHGSIARVVERALDPNPERRPSTADEMARLLAQVTTHRRNWVWDSANQDRLEYRSTAAGSELTVTVTKHGQRRSVETRYRESCRRVTAACVDTTASGLARELRRIFDKEII